MIHGPTVSMDPDPGSTGSLDPGSGIFTFVPLLCYCCQYKRLIMYPRIPDPEIQDSSDPGIQDPGSRIQDSFISLLYYHLSV